MLDLDALQEQVTAMLGPEGRLSQISPHFRFREAQLAMAQAVARSILQRSFLLAEAGTGTGKTYAYLLPALLAGGKVIVSTGSKTLQDQLYLRDIPQLTQQLGLPARVALLKGRNNYLCLHRLETAATQARLPSRALSQDLARIVRQASGTERGDRAEIQEVPEDSAIWPWVTSTRDNCLGQECPRFKDCHVVAARREAMAADVVVVNHHLFFADVWLKDEGGGELLPQCNTVVFDEAHQLPEVANQFFGEHLSMSQILELLRDSKIMRALTVRDMPQWDGLMLTLEKAVRDFRLVFRQEQGRLNVDMSRQQPGFADAMQHLRLSMEAHQALLEAIRERSPDAAKLADRGLQQSKILQQWGLATQDEVSISWLELGAKHWVLHQSPISLDEVFSQHWQNNPRSWILTSATLSVNGDFSHYMRELGLSEAEQVSLPSPFDYAQQAVLYVPEALPEPNQPGFVRAMVEAIWPLLRHNRGRAFVLFTSLRALNEAQSLLRALDTAENLGLTWLVQGEAPRSILLDQFTQSPHAVLLGSQSFWEGVDVAGDALTLVVIDRLPFAPPDDPVLVARLDVLKRQGGQPFNDYQLPQAAISLKQGAGRLIRREDDYGVLVLCDVRIAEKHYGKRLLAALPPMRRTRKAEVALARLGPAPAVEVATTLSTDSTLASSEVDA